MSPRAMAAHGEQEKCFPALPSPSHSQSKPPWLIPQFPAKPSHFGHPSSLWPFQRPPWNGLGWKRTLKLILSHGQGHLPYPSLFQAPAHPGKVGMPRVARGRARSNPSWKTPGWDHKEAKQPSVLRAKIWVTHPKIPTVESEQIQARLSHLPVIFSGLSVPFLPPARSSAGICRLIPRSGDGAAEAWG